MPSGYFVTLLLHTNEQNASHAMILALDIGIQKSLFGYCDDQEGYGTVIELKLMQ